MRDIMKKNIRLANLYVKIRNKRALTIDDLIFLSKFDPECFKKTCSNLLYNLPEAGVLLENERNASSKTASVKQENTTRQGSQPEGYSQPTDKEHSMEQSQSPGHEQSTSHSRPTGQEHSMAQSQSPGHEQSTSHSRPTGQEHSIAQSQSPDRDQPAVHSHPSNTMFVSKSNLEQEKVDALLDNLKKMEWEGSVITEIDSDKVKNLLGNLYMEMLFPHDDKVKFFCLEDHIECSLFNKKV